MAYLGRKGALAPVTAADIPDNSITSAKIVDDSVTTVKILDDNVTAAKIPAGAVSSDVVYLENNTSTQDLSGTYSTERLYFNDSYQMTGDVTVTGHLALGSIADEDIIITNDDTERTLTVDGGVIEAGGLLAEESKDLTGMTGTLGSVVTGGAGLSGMTSLGTVTTGTLGSGVTFPAGHIINSSAVQTYSSYYETSSSSYVVVPSFVLGPFSFTAGNKVWVLLSTDIVSHNGGNDSGVQVQMSTSSSDNTDLVGVPKRGYIYLNTNYEPQSYGEVTFSNIFSPSGTSVTYYLNIKAPNGGSVQCARDKSTMQFFEIQA